MAFPKGPPKPSSGLFFWLVIAVVSSLLLLLWGWQAGMLGKAGSFLSGLISPAQYAGYGKQTANNDGTGRPALRAEEEAARHRADAERKARELLDFLRLSDRIAHKPAALSGGEKQRVAVARALINRPSVVLADEPSGSLDSHSKDELHSLFFDLRRELGQTFVIVTHDEQLAAQADRTIRMRDGIIL